MSVQTCAKTRSFSDFAYNLKSKQNKKNPEHTFQALLNMKRMQDLSEILDSIVVGAGQNV